MAIALLTATALCAGEVSPAQLFARLERLDSLDTTKLQFVKVATGQWSQTGNRPPVNSYRHGFLVRDDKEAFTVRYGNLTEQHLRPTPPKTAEHERVGYVLEDLGEYARTLATQLPTLIAGGRYHGATPYSWMGARGEAVLLARACHQRGLQAEAQRLLEAVGDPESAWLEIAEGTGFSLVADFANGDLSRDQLLAKHELWLEVFEPSLQTKDRDRPQILESVQRRIETLKRMLAEEKDRAKRVAKQSASPEDLVFQLRDEHHEVEGDGFYFSRLTIETRVEKTNDRPVDQLVTLGHKAVPALLDALGDDTLTRCVVYSYRSGDVWVLTVSDLAKRTLSAISGLWFDGGDDKSEEKWRLWWKDVSEQGELAALATLAARGDHDSDRAARRLLSLSPRTIEPVLAGLRNGKRAYVRESFLKVLIPIESEDVTAMLLEEVQSGPFIEPRVVAAEALLARDRREGIDMFMALWEKPELIVEEQDPLLPRAAVGGDNAVANRRARSELIDFLLSCGDPAAVAIVTKDVRKQPPKVRQAILSSLFRASRETIVKRAKPAQVARLDELLENVLGHLLDDKTVSWGSGCCSVRGSTDHPRYCDIAAYTLGRYWPERYSFDPTGPGRLKDRRLVKLKNTWREKQGLPLLPPLLEQPPAQHGNVVTIVSFSTDERHPLPDLEERLETLRGKPLKGAGFVDLLLAALESLPERAGDIVVLADRVGDGSGVNVELEVASVSAEHKGDNVSVSVWGMAGDQSVMGSYGGGARQFYDEKSSEYQEVIAAMDKALSLPEEKTFEFRIELHVR